MKKNLSEKINQLEKIEIITSQVDGENAEDHFNPANCDAFVNVEPSDSSRCCRSNFISKSIFIHATK